MIKLPEWANWVARDVDRDLYVFNHKPEKIGGEWIIWTDNGKCKAITGELKESFNDVKWTDEEPTLITHELNSLIISNDLVNKPNHYNVGGIETIDIIKSMLTEEEFKGYIKGNILKYRERAEHKGNAEQDYAKAKKYYDWLEELE